MKKEAKNRTVTIYDLAIMVAKGFSYTATKDEMQSGFKAVLEIGRHRLSLRKNRKQPQTQIRYTGR